MSTECFGKSAAALALIVILWCAIPLTAQGGAGELRLAVTDPTGGALVAEVELVSQANQVALRFRTDRGGHYVAGNLPFGVYRLAVQHPGFAPFSELIHVRSEIPLEYRVVLSVSPVATTVHVTDSATLLDPRRTGTVYAIGPDALRERPAAPPGRSIVDLVAMQPGWVLEANGVLHPRGAEYDTQYVLDGIPIVDNRSPPFMPGLEIEEVRSMRILTGNYPAEYGRKLGGVIELTRAQTREPGFHGKAVFQAGSFSSQNGYAEGQYGRRRITAALGLHGSHTLRYLDPPVEENFTNRGSPAGLTARFESDLSGAERLSVLFERKRVGFLVPNEWAQQEAGQRQDRWSTETRGVVSYQRVFSPRLVGVGRGMVRELSARLWSNSLATPIVADQDRGFREGYLSGTLSANRGAHQLKAGSEWVLTAVREQFAYRISDPGFFDPEVPPNFAFAERQRGWESSLFLQDMIQAGRWTVSAGVRWDIYRLLVRRSALSPRLGMAWSWPSAGMVFHASYDRAFQIPALENLLLASSVAAQRLTLGTTGLPVPPSTGNFYQAGFSKTLFGKVRFDGEYFRRNLRDFADDDVFLNTGVSFPIAFSRATIRGFDAKLDMPRWGRFSGFLSYSNLVGEGFLPVTGGLFLEADSSERLRSAASFPISQDQRNTLHARIRFQPALRFWLALGARYGSGLPIEGEFDFDELQQHFSGRILERVDFARGRVRPWHSYDLSLGAELAKRHKRSLRLQADVINLTNRLDVINFASLFSGTSLRARRTFSLRLATEF